MPNRRVFISASLTAAAATVLPSGVRAAEDLRVAFIPEVATTAASFAEKAPLVELLERATGRHVRLIVPTSYAATVEAIGNDGLDLAYFGGLTYLKARERYEVRPLVQRLEDRRFHALYIASAANPRFATLRDLRGKTFAFGDVNSTSGHLIPAKELFDAGIDPDKDLRARFTGNHTATAIAVSSGQVDAGAIDETIYRKLVSDKTIDPAKARVFSTSKPFLDYVWAVRKDLDSETVTELRHAFLQMRDRKVLDLLRATHYVTANDRSYDALREIARKLHLL